MPTVGVVMRNMQKICPEFVAAEHGKKSQFKNVFYHKNSKVYVASYKAAYKGTGRSDVEALTLILEECKDLTVNDFYVPPMDEAETEEDDEDEKEAPRGSPKAKKRVQEKASQGQGEKGAKKREAPEPKEVSSIVVDTPPRKLKGSRSEASPEMPASSKRTRKAANSL